MREKDVQNEIRLAVNEYAVIFRTNVGTFLSADGRYISTGLPKGFSDLFGVRRSDGKAVFLEIKNETGRARPEQIKFIEQMKKNGAIAGVVRSPREAVDLINGSMETTL